MVEYKEEEEQDKNILQPWIDPHNLHKIHGVWWKEGRQVVTGDDEYRQLVIESVHDSPVYGHPGISQTMEIVK